MTITNFPSCNEALTYFQSHPSPCFFPTSRPLEDEPSTITSEPKRTILESSTSIPNTSAPPKETYTVPAATSQAALGSTVDLFGGQSEAHSDRLSHAAHKEPQSRKRKQMNEVIQMDELESIMSEDMDWFDESPSEKAPQAQMIIHSSTDINEASSKRQRVHLGENGTKKMQQPQQQQPQQQQSSERESSSFKNNNPKSAQQTVSVTKEKVQSEYVTAYHECSKPPQASSTTASTNAEPFDDDEVRTYPLFAFFLSCLQNKLKLSFSFFRFMLNSVFNGYCNILILFVHLGFGITQSGNLAF